MSGQTRKVRIGSVTIGGGSSVAVQSMTTTDTKDIDATVAQIRALEEAGCDIVRVALYDEECAQAAAKIREQIRIPLVGDVHFSARIALDAIEAGIDKIRINPGNIGSAEDVSMVARAAKAAGIPLRVGSNSGSVPKGAGSGCDALVIGTLSNIEWLENAGFEDIVVSVKSSSVPECVQAARVLSRLRPYPLHLGVTEAGTYERAVIKSAAGIGALLLDGIGDTIRVSISGDPVREVHVGKALLESLGLREQTLEIISCPTCARCRSFDVEQLARQAETLAEMCEFPMRLAVMGCEVNGPGEARRADLGIAGGRGRVALFEDGRVTGTYSPDQAFAALAAAVKAFQDRRRQEVAGKSGGARKRTGGGALGSSRA
ncbi:MAG: flavodoxin-dependent (E)-4-hydroxy-3-methylbut-2-enyl-diphosphate synthase [Clostridia bacterium]|nr:flavodoxin-dependent (E)-4-hydroxy-3-methylbut-2-enyl-diphosphate synthase [Clostridia bacterium]